MAENLDRTGGRVVDCSGLENRTGESPEVPGMAHSLEIEDAQDATFAACSDARDGAQVGDGVYVSGTIGDAGLGLKVALQQLQGFNLSAVEQEFCRARLDFPQPRIALGLALRGLASACLDISDGLAQDLGHILQASHVGAELQLERLPLSESLNALPPHQALALALTSGDDYELCFTMPDANLIKLSNAAVPVTRIGTIVAATGLHLTHHGQPYKLNTQGYQHF